VNLRQLECFCAVAESLNFSRAAAKIGIAQPPLSMQIKNLETELGVELFDRRSAKQIALTTAGRELLPHARRALNSAAAVVQLAKARTGRIAVGAGFSALLTIVPDIIRILETKEPQIEIFVHSMVGRQQIAALLDGTIDVGIARGPVSHPELISEPLFQEVFVAAMPSNHRLVAKHQVDIKDMREERLIVTVSHPMSYNLSETALSFFSGEANLNVRHRVRELSAAISLVRAGLGISLVPETLRKIVIDGVVYRPLKGRAPVSTVCLVRHHQTGLGIIEAFVTAARAASSDLSLSSVGIRRKARQAAAK
jgi:LysR family transcriptional regulator, benzoate and cis,cis-muconate-responsive activator of ben and cat genes